jgi:hypothetical protein
MFTPNLEGFCPPSTSPRSICSPDAPIVLPFPSAATPCTPLVTQESSQPLFFLEPAHSFRHTGGCTPLAESAAQSLPDFSTVPRLCMHSTARNSNLFIYLLHSSLCTREWGSPLLSNRLGLPSGAWSAASPLAISGLAVSIHTCTFWAGHTTFNFQPSTFQLFKYNPRTSLRGTNER